MSRRIKPEKREVTPDVRFNNVHIQMMINRIMLNGKKSTVTSLVYDAIDQISQKTGIPRAAVRRCSAYPEAIGLRRFGNEQFFAAAKNPDARLFVLVVDAADYRRSRA